MATECSGQKPLIPWSDALEVGIAEIDAQHRWLVDATNRLYACTSGTVERAEILGLLEGLMEYTVNHFIAEEALFDQCEFPGAAAHKALHGQFTTRIMNALMEFEDGGELGEDLLEMLRDWLVAHIMKIDKAYVPYVTQGTKAE